MNEIRPNSLRAVRTLFELMFSAQAAASDGFSSFFLKPEQLITVNPSLPKRIELDDVDEAVSILPALGERSAEEVADRVRDLFRAHERRPTLRADELISHQLVVDIGLTGFHPSREYYRRSRRADVSSIDKYVASARETVVIVSVNLQTGVGFDDLRGLLRERLTSAGSPLMATISLLDPRNPELLGAMAPNLEMDASQLAESIEKTAAKLLKFRGELPAHAQSRLTLRFHSVLPFASAIMLDHALRKGRIQVETKPFGAMMNKSLGFEVTAGGTSGLYETLASSYEEVVRRGREMAG